MSRSILMFIAMAASAINLQAQSGSATALQGAKVRIRVATSLGRADGVASIEGRFVEQRADSIRLLDRDGAVRTVRGRDVLDLEVSRGKSIGDGAMRGALLGGAIGLLVGLTTSIECTHGQGIDCLDDGSTPTRGQYNLESTSVFAFAGALLGAFFPIERWEHIRPATDVRVGAATSGASLSVRTFFR